MPIMTAKPPLWTLEDALAVVRDLQFKALQCGYHLALAGGVLNKGYSHNDLDVIVMPLDGKDQKRDKFLESVERQIGPVVTLGKNSIPDQDGNVVRATDGAQIVDFLFYHR